MSTVPLILSHAVQISYRTVWALLPAGNLPRLNSHCAGFAKEAALSRIELQDLPEGFHLELCASLQNIYNACGS